MHGDYSYDDFQYLSWAEFQTAAEKISGEVKKFCAEHELNIDCVVPILRGGGPLGISLSHLLNIARFYPCQYKYEYVESNGGQYVPVEYLTTTEFVANKSDNLTILVTEGNHVRGGTALKCIQKIKSVLPNVKIIYASVGRDYAHRNRLPGTVFETWGFLTNETEILSKYSCINRSYFDNNATTRLSVGVKQCIIDSMDLYYNPSSLYSEGQYVKERIESARNNVAQLIGAEAKNIIFTGCATESNNTVISTCIDSSALPKKHIVVSSVEHSAILEAVKHYEKLGCIELTILPVDSFGRIKLDDVRAAIKDNTILVSIMLVNNEVGNIYPIKEFVEDVKKINPLTKFHTDATQAIGKYKVDIKELNVDYLTLSGHKFHALKGIGALYIKTINDFKPFMYGGHQENGRRAGTENTLGILTMGQAAKEVMGSLDADIELMANLRDYLEKQLTKLNVGANSGRYSFLGDLEHRVCNTSCILIDGFDGRLVCTTVDTDGETDDSSISSGSACNSGDLEASHVMQAMGIKQIPIRVSFDRYNTLDEVRIFIRKLQKALNKLKNQGANT